MPILAAFALANLKRDIGAALGWLSKATVWQIGCIVLGAWLLVVKFQLADARSDAARYAKQRDYYRSELQRISTAKNEQKRETIKTVERARVIVKQADRQAEKVEQSALPGECKTPALDTLRNVL